MCTVTIMMMINSLRIIEWASERKGEKPIGKYRVAVGMRDGLDLFLPPTLSRTAVLKRATMEQGELVGKRAGDLV